jgi:hypothetical protein
LHSPEHSSDETNSLYLGILGRNPSAAELSAGTSFLSGGGNSDALTLILLSGPEFSAKHASNSAFVAAVNQYLISTGVPSSTTKLEIAELNAGKRRSSLVQSIMRSERAAQLKVTQLSNLYLGYTVGASVKDPLVAGLVNGTLNSDQVTVKLLSSLLFLNVAETTGIPQAVNAQNGLSPLYDRLNHLVSALTGDDATGAELDALYQQQVDGASWLQIVSEVDRSQAAQTDRIQTQYRNLLGRPASASEQAKLEKTLPPNNQTEALQVRILASHEYRNQYASTPAYVNAVYTTLTGRLPAASTLRKVTRSLNAGASTAVFVRKVANSKAGRIGQIDREYADLLLRNPSRLELQSILKRGHITDHSLTLTIAKTLEVSRKQLSTRAIRPS